MVLGFIPPSKPVLVPMDDTTAQHRGKNVYGKGCHHDAVRSTHSHMVWRWGHRRVELVTGTGHWYKRGQGLVPVRWVFVHDIEGTHRDEYIFTTAVDLDPVRIVSWFTARWKIETTFQEVREHLGFETTCQWVRKSVLRTGPCLLGLFSVVALAYAEHRRRHPFRSPAIAWYTKTEPTFADAPAAVRRLLWTELLFAKGRQTDALQKLPRRTANADRCPAKTTPANAEDPARLSQSGRVAGPNGKSRA